MRNVNTSDLFSAMRLVKLAGVSDRIKPILQKYSGVIKEDDNEEDADKVRRQFGMDLLFELMDGFSRKETEAEFYNFLSSIMEVKPEDIRNLPPKELFDAFKELAGNEGWRDFFTQLANLITMK